MIGTLCVLCALVLNAPSPGTLLDQLQALDSSLEVREPELALLEARERERLQELFAVQAELSQSRLRAAEIKLIYQRRLRALHRMPSGARMIAIGQSSSLDDYLKTARVLRWVTQYDRTILADKQAIVDTVQKLERLEATKLQAAAALTESARTLRDTLAQQRATRLRSLHPILSGANWSAGLSPSDLAAGESLRTRFSKLIPSSPLAARFYDNRGKLPWPVQAPISLAFGHIESTGQRTRLTSRGIHFNAPAGTPTQAVAAGTVVYADWLDGYGNLVIIDHGEGYHSLSAHLSQVDVKSGDSLGAQQLVGTVGDTGSRRGTEFYFEIRKDAEAVDPMGWLRK